VLAVLRLEALDPLWQIDIPRQAINAAHRYELLLSARRMTKGSANSHRGDDCASDMRKALIATWDVQRLCFQPLHKQSQWPLHALSNLAVQIHLYLTFAQLLSLPLPMHVGISQARDGVELLRIPSSFLLRPRQPHTVHAHIRKAYQ